MIVRAIVVHDCKKCLNKNQINNPQMKIHYNYVIVQKGFSKFNECLLRNRISRKHNAFNVYF